jgi:hypothetical protein
MHPYIREKLKETEGTLGKNDDKLTKMQEAQAKPLTSPEPKTIWARLLQRLRGRDAKRSTAD